MRVRFLVPLFLFILCGAHPAIAASGPPYYLALGDSLAQGVQWSPTGDVITTFGYADDLFNQFSKTIPGLTLAKLGCPGETSSSMISGGECQNYSQGSSQLDAAVSFLQTHQVAFVTLDIGANDVDGCITSSGVDTSCVQAGFSSVSSNLPWIIKQLRSAAGPRTPIIAMNYYDPFLAGWTLGSSGRAIALQSLEAATEFNLILGTIYAVFEIPVADVAHAFHTYNLLPVPGENLPVNVFTVLSWTWMTAPPPYGPDIHPNSAGYAAIAAAFVEKIVLR
jgi:lysophospholipase L1-like esterase